MSQRLDGVPRLSDGTPWAPVGFGSLRRRSLARFSWIVTSWLCAGSLSGCLDRSGKPGFLEVTPPSMEFLVRLRSDGSEHKPLEATFQVKNGGGRPVNILRIEKSCGCTQPRIAPSSQIAPSQWARLIAMVDPPLHGERRVELTLTTEYPINAHARDMTPNRSAPNAWVRIGMAMSAAGNGSVYPMRLQIVLVARRCLRSRSSIPVAETSRGVGASATLDCSDGVSGCTCSGITGKTSKLPR